MAIVRSTTRAEVIIDALRTFFHHARDQLRSFLKRRKVYKSTFHEPARLTDRELADLGIPRSNIRRLAWEAADDA